MATNEEREIAEATSTERTGGLGVSVHADEFLAAPRQFLFHRSYGMGTTAIEEIGDPEQLLHRLDELNRRLSRLELLGESHQQLRQAEIEAANPISAGIGDTKTEACTSRLDCTRQHLRLI